MERDGESLFPSTGPSGPRAWLPGWILLLGTGYYYIVTLRQGIVQSDLVPNNHPYTVLTSVVEMKPKGTC